MVKSARHFGGTSVLEYATGEANIKNWMTNGTMAAMSRYSALRAQVHRPTASAVICASSTNSGISNIPGPAGIRTPA